MGLSGVQLYSSCLRSAVARREGLFAAVSFFPPQTMNSSRVEAGVLSQKRHFSSLLQSHKWPSPDITSISLMKHVLDPVGICYLEIRLDTVRSPG